MEVYEANPWTLAGNALELVPAMDRHPSSNERPGRLPQLLFQRADSHPEHPFVLTATGQWSYADVAGLVRELSSRLRASPDCQAGDRIVIALQNSLEYIVSLLGTMAAGMVAVPVPPDMEINRLQRIISLAAPTRILASGAWLKKFRAATASQPVMTAAMESAYGRHVPDELAAIMFTSGSTGVPKGVMLTHGNLCANAASIVKYLQISSNERAAVVVPFYHAMGNSILTSHLAAGGTLLLGQSIMFPEDLLDNIDHYAATSLSGVPEVFHRLLEHSSLPQRHLPSLRYMSVAGGRLSSPAVERVRNAIAPARFFVMYGQTEATARLSYVPPQMLSEKLGSIGVAVPGVTLQIVDADGQALPAEAIGELRAAGANISPGYWCDPETTQQVFRDGWLYTGDVGRIDRDGFIHLEGRQKGFLKRYGFRMHTREIDEFLMQRLHLRQAVTIAFPREGEPGLAVFAQPRVGQTCSREELQRICATSLPRFKQPDYFEIVDEFPLNDSLKIDQHALQQRVLRCA